MRIEPGDVNETIFVRHNIMYFFKDWIFDLGIFYVVFGAFVVVGAGNAVNLTDGLDGLAIVPIMIAAASFGVIAYELLTGCRPFDETDDVGDHVVH